MNIFHRALNGVLRPFGMAAIDRDELALWSLPGGWTGTKSEAGIYISPETAMRVSVVNRCVRILSDSLATIPAKVYRRKGPDDSREEVRGTDAGRIFQSQANPWQTGSQLRAQGQESLLHKGRMYWRKVVVQGRVQELLPIESHRVLERRTLSGYSFSVSSDPGSVVLPRGASDLGKDEVLRLEAPGGVGVLENARNAAGLAAAQEIMGSRIYAHGANFSGVLETSLAPGSAALEMLGQSFNEAHAGIERSQKVVPLPKGIKFQQTSMTAEDADFLESRKFQVEDIARFYAVPPSVLGSTGALPRSNVEEAWREFVVVGLRPWLVLWETQLNLDIFGPDSELFLELNADGLIRGDIKTRYEAYRIGLGGQPFLAVNQVRRMENMNSVDGGDEIKQPVNLRGLDSQEQAGQEEDE